MVEYHPISAKDILRVHQFGTKVLSEKILSYVFCAEEIWNGNILNEVCKELEQMDRSELHVRRLYAKEVLTSMKGETFIFPVADGTVKVSGRDRYLRTSFLIRDSPDRREERKNLREISVGFYSTSWQDTTWYDDEAKNDFWSISGDFIYRDHVEHRVKLYLSSEESFSISLIYIYVTRSTLDLMSEKYWRVLERWWRSWIVRYLDWFYKMHHIGWNTAGWVYMIWTGTDKKTKDLKARQIVTKDVGTYIWSIKT